MIPELITLSHYQGDIEIYLEAVYQIYLSEIVSANLLFLELPIRCQYKPPFKNKHFGFWHLVSEGKKEEDRIINLRRCERIKWISYVLQNAHDFSIIKCWQNERFGNTHIVLWMHQYDFLVILARRKTYLVLKTAYPVTERYQIKKLEKEREKCQDPRGYKG
jgi:hypothetical protein